LLQIPTVPNLGCRVQKGKLRETLGSFPDRPLPGVVIEDLYRTDHLTVSAPDRTDTNLHRHPVAILVVKVNIRPVLKAIRQGMAERAVYLTKQTPRLVHMH